MITFAFVSVIKIDIWVHNFSNKKDNEPLNIPHKSNG